MEFQALYGELQNSTEMIRALLAGISQDAACMKMDPESWSILEVVCHLYDEEREDFREHLDFILHRQHEEWKSIDPQGWVTEREYNERNLVEMQDKFFNERWKSLDWLNGLSNTDWNTTYTSPFGSMSAGDMVASWVAHDNLHIRQLVEIRRKLLETITEPYNLQYAGDW